MVIDNIIAGFKTKSEITIISEKNKEISKFILDDLEEILKVAIKIDDLVKGR